MFALVSVKPPVALNHDVTSCEHDPIAVLKRPSLIIKYMMLHVMMPHPPSNRERIGTPCSHQQSCSQHHYVTESVPQALLLRNVDPACHAMPQEQESVRIGFSHSSTHAPAADKVTAALWWWRESASECKKPRPTSTCATAGGDAA
jgi:hypothetical protein